MKKWLMVVMFATMLVLAACGGGDSGDTSEPADNDEGTEESGSVDTAAAEDAYKASCASCHGQNLEGGAGPSLENAGSDLSADEIEDIIVNGVGSMPGGLLSGDDATAVAEWLANH